MEPFTNKKMTVLSVLPAGLTDFECGVRGTLKGPKMFFEEEACDWAYLDFLLTSQEVRQSHHGEGAAAAAVVVACVVAGVAVCVPFQV